MNLKDKIKNDIKEAMKTKDNIKRDALRLLASAFKQIEVDQRVELSDEDCIKIITKQVKQRDESMRQYKEAGRDDLYEKEKAELELFKTYLPAQLSDDELKDAVSTIITKLGATSMKDMGKVMGMASKELQGKADGKRVSECVKNLLN